jgi:hypothetical protein
MNPPPDNWLDDWKSTVMAASKAALDDRRSGCVKAHTGNPFNLLTDVKRHQRWAAQYEHTWNLMGRLKKPVL